MEWEFVVLDWIQEHLACAFLDTFIPIFTSLGNAGICWIIAALVLICTKKYRANGIVMLLALLVGALIGNLTLKPLIARPRPCWEINMTPLIPIPEDFSFPSGHTVIGDRSDMSDMCKQAVWSDCHPLRGCHGIYSIVSLCTLPDRYSGGDCAGHYNWTADATGGSRI